MPQLLIFLKIHIESQLVDKRKCNEEGSLPSLFIWNDTERTRVMHKRQNLKEMSFSKL